MSIPKQICRAQRGTILTPKVDLLLGKHQRDPTNEDTLQPEAMRYVWAQNLLAVLGRDARTQAQLICQRPGRWADTLVDHYPVATGQCLLVPNLERAQYGTANGCHGMALSTSSPSTNPESFHAPYLHKLNVQQLLFRKALPVRHAPARRVEGRRSPLKTCSNEDAESSAAVTLCYGAGAAHHQVIICADETPRIISAFEGDVQRRCGRRDMRAGPERRVAADNLPQLPTGAAFACNCKATLYQLPADRRLTPTCPVLLPYHMAPRGPRRPRISKL
eukprot:355136-Chlamydomonas_euryale.AAC.11